MERFLIIGFGGSGQREYSIIREILPQCDIAIWYTGTNNYSMSDEHILVRTPEEALGFNPEGVFIATPTSKHLEYAELFLGVAKFILIDKPLDMSLNKSEIFLRNSKYTKTKVYINFQRRYLECWQKVYELIQCLKNEEFIYGKVEIKSNYKTWRPDKEPHTLYVARADLGGGVLLTECHEIDLLQWLLGKATSANGRFNNINIERNEVENEAQILLDFEFAYGRRTVSMLLDDLSLEEVRTSELHFSQTSIYVDEIKGEVLVKRQESSKLFIFDDSISPHKKLLEDILSVQENWRYNECLPTGQDGLNVLAVIEAVKKSNTFLYAVECVDSVCPKEGIQYLNIAIEKLQKIFSNRLKAVYGLGSLGYGGYVEKWSDFDIDVIVDEQSKDEAINDYIVGKEIENEIKKLGFDRIDIRVYSIENLNQRDTVLTYGQCSRATMLCDSAILLAGKDLRGEVVRPSKQEQNAEAIGLLKHMMSNSEEWWQELPWDDIAAHFALVARFIYTSKTGKVAGKKKALEFLLDTKQINLEADEIQWILWALSCRVNYNHYYYQECLHDNAVVVLKKMFGKTYRLLTKETK